MLLASLGLMALQAVSVSGTQPDSIPTISLAEAIRRAYDISPATVTARGQLGTIIWARRAAVAALFTPSLTVGGNVNSLSPPVVNFNVLPPGGAFTALSPTSHTTDGNIQVAYTFFAGGQSLFRLRAARAGESAARANDDAVHSSTRVEVETVYYAVVADQELLRVAEEQVQTLTEQLAISRARVRAGAAAQTDSLQVLLQLTTARVSLLRQHVTVDVDRLALGRRIGLSTPVGAQPLDTLPAPPLPLSLNEAVNMALASGPAYLRARAGERAVTAQLAVQVGGFIPSLTLSATRFAYGDALPPNKLYRNQFSVGLSFPILDQGVREAGLVSARASADSARAARADLERGAAQDVTSAYEAYNTARTTVDMEQLSVLVARENLRVATLRYRTGAENILNLLTAQVALTQAESDLVSARRNTRLALASLQSLTGKTLIPGEH
ncbi:MAG: outer membrane protein assembly factor YaeT precursor [Gemmatimonadetes bacterium]|nr:outer membrane protein assembly factor YaeT precursor [Gemmatimonadota bacterium]